MAESMVVGQCAYCGGAVTQLAVTAPAACSCGRASIPEEFLRNARGIGQVAPAPPAPAPVVQLPLFRAA